MENEPEAVAERLRASEARLRAILDSQPECVKTVSLDGRLLEMNPAGLRMIEVADACEVIGREISELIHPEDRSAYFELHRRAAGGGGGQLQFRIVGLKGTERWVETNSVALRAEDGTVVSVLSVTHDIGARRRAEAALRDSEDRYRDLVENSSDLICTHDLEGNLLSVNETLSRLTGSSREVLLTMNIADLLAPDVRGEVIAYLNAIRSHGHASGLMKIRTADGETRYWEYNNTLRSAGVPVPVVRGKGQDVTEARRAATALRLSEARHEQAAAALRRNEAQLLSFIENAPADIAMFDNHMICLAASQRWISAYGRGHPTPVGLSHYEVNPDLPERWKEIHRRGLTGSSQASDEDLWVQADGTQQWLRWSMEPWRDSAGAIGGIVLLVEDISARKLAEAATLAEKAFSEAMLDSLPGVVCLFDQTGRLLRWNRAFESVSEYTPTEIAALRPRDLVSAEDEPRIAARVEQMFERGHADIEAAITTKSGRRIPYYFVGTTVNWNGLSCCIGTGIDVSARKLLEAELRQSQKIEAIGRLAGGVAHDFNNILGVILGYGELVQAELVPGTRVSDQVAEMVRAAERAAALTRQLQAFSRKQILQPRCLDLNELVGSAHKMLDRVIGEDIELVVRPAPDLGTVRADPGQIEQILLNLAINARDAMPKGGVLTLETADVDLCDDDFPRDRAAMKPGHYVMLAVSDTGVGMDAETEGRLFEPFFTTKPVGQGTGLGLSTVYGIVKQSDGYIWVDTELGLGTTFRIYLPRVDERPDANRPSGAIEILPGGRETILLVEDNLALREVTRLRLEEKGYEVLVAGDGEAALALAGARSEAIDLLLTDVVMPKLGGGELAERLIALHPGLPVLFMSGYTDGAIAQHGILPRGVALLEKPFSGERLVRMVRSTLDRTPLSDFSNPGGS